MARARRALAAAHFAFVPRFQPLTLTLLRHAARVQQASCSRIATSFDRVYLLADFVAAQHAQRAEIMRVRARRHSMHLAA